MHASTNTQLQNLATQFSEELIKLNSQSFLLQEELTRLSERRKEIFMALAVLKALPQEKDAEPSEDV